MFPNNEENNQAKVRFIEAFFREMEQRVAFLDELFRNNHKDEALLLCCCYIEGFGNNSYFPDKGNCRNFVRILKEYSDKELFWHIHPKQLQKKLADDRTRKILRRVGEKLDGILTNAEDKFYPENEILEIVSPVLKECELTNLSENLWSGTFAAIAYERIRNDAVHSFGAVDISFQSTTFRGEPVPNIGFRLLYPALQNVFESVKEKSFRSTNWFGNKSIL